MWEPVFGFVNLVALVSHAILIFLPRRPFLMALVLYGGIAILCLVYAVGIVGLFTGTLDGGAGEARTIDFTTLQGVTGIFATEGGATIGWTHYLAFDLFVALWIARDADDKDVSRFIQAPILLTTFMAGPLGLLIWLVFREPRARRRGRPT